MKQESELLIRTETREIWSIRRILSPRDPHLCERCAQHIEIEAIDASGPDTPETDSQEGDTGTNR